MPNKVDIATPAGKPDPYTRLGVRPFINCCGTRTVHGGSIMVPAAVRAMQDSAARFVNINELMEGVGRRLAELTGAPWAIVTCGGSAGLCHATAAAIAGADPEMMLRLPDTRGMRNRVIMTQAGRFAYDHAVRMVGAEIVEAETRGDLDAVLDDRVAMVCLLGKKESDGALSLEEIVDAVRPRGIPVLVDAASEHLEKPDPYLARGATMVSYSGGKFLRGPQPSGLLLGERAWLEAAWRNSAPHHAFGRPLKVGKEEVMGLLAAVEHWAAGRDDVVELRTWTVDLETIAGIVTTLDGVSAEVILSVDPTEKVPRLLIDWAGAHLAFTGLGLRRRLMDGEPRIMIDDRFSTDSSFYLDPFSLQPGEAAVVGERIREELATAPVGGFPSPTGDPEADVGGAWDVEIAFYRGFARHRLHLHQSGTALAGEHVITHQRNPVTGSIHGRDVRLSSKHAFEGTNLAYAFSGRVEDDAMSGLVRLGSSGNSAPGPLNEREYGEGNWRAKRRFPPSVPAPG